METLLRQYEKNSWGGGSILGFTTGQRSFLSLYDPKFLIYFDIIGSEPSNNSMDFVYLAPKATLAGLP